MSEPLNPLQPQFSVAEFSHLAGLDRALVDLRVHRGLIKPTKIDRLTVRQRASFSIAAVFEANVVRMLDDELAIGISEAGKAASAIANVDGGAWMHNAARHAEKGEVMDLHATVHRSKGCWQAFLHLGIKNVRDDFGKEATSLLVPAGAVFFTTYETCKALSAGAFPAKKRGKK
jgi:hypothetical protein